MVKVVNGLKGVKLHLTFTLLLARGSWLVARSEGLDYAQIYILKSSVLPSLCCSLRLRSVSGAFFHLTFTFFTPFTLLVAGSEGLV